METVLKMSEEEAMKKLMVLRGINKHNPTSDEELKRIREEVTAEFLREKGWD